MPSSSAKQHRFMAAVANNPKFAKRVGVPTSVGEDFMTADKGKKFREGGNVKKGGVSRDTLLDLAAEEELDELKEHKRQHDIMGKKGYAKGGGIAMRGTGPARKVSMAKGGMVRGGGCESKGKTRGKFV
jgi:hypothetical protein